MLACSSPFANKSLLHYNLIHSRFHSKGLGSILPAVPSASLNFPLLSSSSPLSDCLTSGKYCHQSFLVNSSHTMPSYDLYTARESCLSAWNSQVASWSLISSCIAPSRSTAPALGHPGPYQVPACKWIEIIQVLWLWHVRMLSFTLLTIVPSKNTRRISCGISWQKRRK